MTATRKAKVSFADLFAALPDGAVLTDSDGIIRDFNATLCEVWPELAVMVTVGAEFEGTVQAVGGVVAIPGGSSGHLTYRRNDGHAVVREDRQLSRGGMLHLFRLSVADDSVGLLDDILQALPDGYAVWDKNDILLAVNPAMRDLAARADPAGMSSPFDGTFREGETYSDALGRFRREGRLPHSAIGREEQWIADRLRRRKTGENSVTQRGRDGSWIEFREIPSPSGALVAWRRDVTTERRRVEALDETTDRLLSIIDGGPMMVLIADVQHRIIEANHTFAAMVGRAPSQLRRREIRDVMDAAAADDMVTLHEKVLQSGRVMQCEEFYATGDGTGLRAWLVTKIPLFRRAAPDEPTGVASVGIEVTERLSSLRKARETEANWRRVLDMLPDAVLVVGRAGVVSFANAAAVSLLGGDGESRSLEGWRATEFFAPPEKAMVLDRLQAAFAGNGGADEPEPDGRYAWHPEESILYSVNGDPVVSEFMTVPLMEDGRVGAALMVIRDVRDREALELERRRRAAELEEEVATRTAAAMAAAEQFAGAVTASLDAFLVIDNVGRLSFVSERFSEYYPWFQQFFSLGKFWADILQEIKRARPRFSRRPEARWWERPDGMIEMPTLSRRWVRLSAARGPSGQCVIAQTDITEYKRQQRRLRRQAMRLEDALAAQRHLVSMVSHELRSPLAVIDSSAQIIQRHGARLTMEDVAGRMIDVREQVARMVTMVDSILATARMDDGRLAMTWDRVKLGELVRITVDEMRSVHVGRQIETQILCPCEVAGDRDLLRLVIANLLSNAMKYSIPSTTITISAVATIDGLELAVSDKGVGIPAQEQTRIFDRYYRASTAFRVRGATGTGIGLSVVKEVVRLHGGQVFVTSAVGQGSTFQVVLPRTGEMCAACGRRGQEGCGQKNCV